MQIFVRINLQTDKAVRQFKVDPGFSRSSTKLLTCSDGEGRRALFCKIY